jgi:hypothetical protein
MDEIIKCQQKILKYESAFNIMDQMKIEQFDQLDQLEKFELKFNHYKITVLTLYSDPDFYSKLKFIELDQNMNNQMYGYMEIIWTHEHYEFIENIRTIESDIKLLLDESYKFGLITHIQFILSTKIFKFIRYIFESDVILKNFYTNHNLDGLNDFGNFITRSNLEFFFNIIGIIILEMYNQKKNYPDQLNKIDLLLENFDYLNLFGELKKSLEDVN